MSFFNIKLPKIKYSKYEAFKKAGALKKSSFFENYSGSVFDINDESYSKTDFSKNNEVLTDDKFNSLISQIHSN